MLRLSIDIKEDNLFYVNGTVYKIKYTDFTIISNHDRTPYRPHKKEVIDTTNAWGFGGYRGYWLHYKGFKVLAVKYYYRHAKTGTYFIKDIKEDEENDN